MATELVLAGDLGGTKTLLALVAPGSPLRVLARERYESARHDSLEAMIEAFLAETGARPERAVIGVAGPVIGGRAQLTNLPYAVDERALEERLGFERARLLNDLEATAYALPFLEEGDFVTLREGRGPARGDFSVVAVGTGLGEALGVHLGETFTVVAGEGGHVDLAPHDDRGLELLRFLWDRLGGHASREAILSGRGISTLFDFVVERGLAPRRLAPSDEEDPNVAVTRAALEGSCPAASLALDLFAAHLGAHAGDVALRSLPRGGVFLAGGIPPRLVAKLREPTFHDAFLDKGRFSVAVEDVRVSIVTAREAPLWGAAHVAFGAGDARGRVQLPWPPSALAAG